MNRGRGINAAVRDRTGATLIEFALIAPILITLLLGMFDLGPAMLVRFKLASATQAVADIATQSPTMQPADVVNIFNVGGDVMTPFASATLAMRITNVASNGLGTAFVYWSCGQGTLPPYIATTPITSTPNGTPVGNLLVLLPSLSGLYLLNGINTSFIMVESQYVFTPPAGLIIQSPQRITTTAYALPRVSTYVGPSLGGLLSFIPIPPLLVIASVSTTVNNIMCNTGI